MGQISGDKARYNRQRRKKIARRVEMRALRAASGGAAAADPARTKTPAKKPTARQPPSAGT